MALGNTMSFRDYKKNGILHYSFFHVNSRGSPELFLPGLPWWFAFLPSQTLQTQARFCPSSVDTNNFQWGLNANSAHKFSQSHNTMSLLSHFPWGCPVLNRLTRPGEREKSSGAGPEVTEHYCPPLMSLLGILGQEKPLFDDVPWLQVLPAWTGYSEHFHESTQRGRNKQEVLFHLR